MNAHFFLSLRACFNVAAELWLSGLKKWVPMMPLIHQTTALIAPVRLLVCIVVRPGRESFAQLSDDVSTIASEGLQNLVLCSEPLYGL